MKKLNRFQKTLLVMFALLAVILASIFAIRFPPPWVSWQLDNPEKEQFTNLNFYFMPNNSKYWCGEFTFTNDADCKFMIVVTNSKSDTLFNQIITPPSDLKEKRFKKRNFTVRGSKEVKVHYIPIDVPKNTSIKFSFRNYYFCNN